MSIGGNDNIAGILCHKDASSASCRSGGLCPKKEIVKNP
jgi:hypothetical protein